MDRFKDIVVIALTYLRDRLSVETADVLLFEDVCDLLEEGEGGNDQTAHVLGLAVQELEENLEEVLAHFEYTGHSTTLRDRCISVDEALVRIPTMSEIAMVRTMLPELAHDFSPLEADFGSRVAADWLDHSMDWECV